MWQWIKDKWISFETWVHSWFPGFKTRTVAAVGALGSAADSAYHFIVGSPPITWLDQKVLAIITFFLFGLSYWFSNMGNRVQSYEQK